MKRESKVLVMDGFDQVHHNGSAATSDLRKLTKRELEVLVLICMEISPGEISERLGISEKTYFNHRSSILLKTGGRTNIGIYKFALRNGLVAD